MDQFLALPLTQACISANTDCRQPPSAMERLGYLQPSRYIHFSVLRNRRTHSTCWLPRGHAQ